VNKCIIRFKINKCMNYNFKILRFFFSEISNKGKNSPNFHHK